MNAARVRGSSWWPWVADAVIGFAGAGVLIGAVYFIGWIGRLVS